MKKIEKYDKYICEIRSFLRKFVAVKVTGTSTNCFAGNL